MMNNSFMNPGMYVQGRGILKVNGAGAVKAEPDMAVIELGVITENTSLKAAQEENAAKSTAVIEALLQMGIPKKQIRTISYNIEPQYDFIEGKQVFRGYKVTNTLSVTIKDTTKVGAVVDRAVASGANYVSNVSFTVENNSAYYNRALELAVRDATEKALQIGRSAGVKVMETPYKITEESTITPMPEAAAMKFSSTATPILPGQINITARIAAVFLYWV